MSCYIHTAAQLLTSTYEEEKKKEKKKEEQEGGTLKYTMQRAQVERKREKRERRERKAALLVSCTWFVIITLFEAVANMYTHSKLQSCKALWDPFQGKTGLSKSPLLLV